MLHRSSAPLLRILLQCNMISSVKHVKWLRNLLQVITKARQAIEISLPPNNRETTEKTWERCSNSNLARKTNFLDMASSCLGGASFQWSRYGGMGGGGRVKLALKPSSLVLRHRNNSKDQR